MSSTVTIHNVKSELSTKRRATEAFQPLQGSVQATQSPKGTSYMTEIPVLANSIFLNVQPFRKDKSGNRFGAKFVGYRALPDGTKGPAEKQNLIHNNGDIILTVDGRHVECQTFNEIVALLSRCCKQNEGIKLEMKRCIGQTQIKQIISPEPKKKKQATNFNNVKNESDVTPHLQLSSVKRDISIEEAKKAAKVVKQEIDEIENTIREHENEADTLKYKIEELQKLLRAEKEKQTIAEGTKENLTKQLSTAMELARPDTSRVLEELRKTIVFGTSGSIAKGRDFMNDLLLLNERKELIEAAHLIGVSKNPALLEGALQVLVENYSNLHPFILQSLFQPMLREGPSSAFNFLDVPWRSIAEGIALAGNAADADLFVRGILACAEKVKFDNKKLDNTRTYGYGSVSQMNRKCHILDIVHPSWEVVIRRFKPEHTSARQSLERVLLNYLYESMQHTIPNPSYCMTVEADIALGEGDKELSAFLRSEKYSGTLSRSQFDWITLQRIIHDRINDAYTMLSYKRDESSNSIFLEKVGIGKPETMNTLRNRQNTHAQILQMLTGKDCKVRSA